MHATTMSQREASLLRRLAQGNDADAFSEITRLYAGVVYGTCLRITGSQEHAADAAQETFYHLLKNAGRITGSLGGWLHQVAVRRAIDLVRRDASRRRHEASFAAIAGAVETDQWADVSPLVDEAIGELEEDLREVLLRHYLQGQSTVQIAAAKGVSQPTISRRIEQALEQLRGKLRAKGILVSAPALVGLMPNATTSAPTVVLRELGKIALTGSGSAASGMATTVFSGLEIKLAMLAVIGVLGVGGFLGYQRNRRVESLLADTASTQPAVETGNRETTVVSEDLPARSYAATPLMAKVASAPLPMMAGEPLVPIAADSTVRTQVESESNWGEAVEGVQVRLRAKQTNWNAGAIPRLFVDVRNQGARQLLVRKQMHGCEVEVDGTWFRPANTRTIAARPSPFPPGREYDGIVINLDNYWQEAGEAARRLGRIRRVPDQLTPGNHTVRVTVTATADQTEPGPPVRAISNPVEIGIVPAQNSEGERK